MKGNPWPVAITLFIAALIGGVVAFAVFSVKHRVDLVAPDYYDQEIRYQQQLDGSRRALRLEGGPVLSVTGQTLSIAVPNHLNATGTVTFYRPSDARLDQVFPLRLDDQGRQAVDLHGLAEGRWRIRVNWVVSNQTFLVEKQTIL